MRLVALRIFLIVFLLAPAAFADEAAVASMTSSQLDTLVAFYTDLHRNPELSFYEQKTAARIAGELRAMGFETTTDVGGHGLVAVMRNGDGPTVMIRTDLDGLPVVENTGRPYASDARATDDHGNDVGVMHACGHDVHMSSFIGTARNLSQLKNQWRGTLVMIGQPAEERGAGARKMLADGLYARFPVPDFVLGLHVNGGLETGKIAYTMGYALANVDSVDITIRGVGGHGAWPHMTKDPVVIAAQVVLALQTIVSRRLSPLRSAVVTVGSIHGGTKHNIIGEEVKLQLTVRSYEDETRQEILDSIRRITLHTARAAGVPPEKEPLVEVQDLEYTPATYNEPELGTRLLPVWRSLLGEDNVVQTEPVMGGEDFSEYGRTDEDIPIFMFWLGTIDPARMAASREPGAPSLPSLHSPEYFPEPRESIRTGVRAMTAAALELLGR